MRALKRPVFIVLIAAAFVVGGAGKASFVQLEHAAFTHDDSAHTTAHNHGGVHQHGGVHAQYDDAAQDQKRQSSLKCCSLCLAVSNELPAAPSAAIELISSRVFYPLACKSEGGLIVVLDPGIPKYIA
jgi:hypothetical protein